MNFYLKNFSFFSKGTILSHTLGKTNRSNYRPSQSPFLDRSRNKSTIGGVYLFFSEKPRVTYPLASIIAKLSS